MLSEGRIHETAATQYRRIFKCKYFEVYPASAATGEKQHNANALSRNEAV